MNAIELLKKLKKVVSFPYKPRSEKNGVWRKIEKRQARDFYERGLFSLEEYNKKIQEINQKNVQAKTRKN